jgi:hypothetical protein
VCEKTTRSGEEGETEQILMMTMERSECFDGKSINIKIRVKNAAVMIKMLEPS